MHHYTCIVHRAGIRQYGRGGKKGVVDQLHGNDLHAAYTKLVSRNISLDRLRVYVVDAYLASKWKRYRSSLFKDTCLGTEGFCALIP